MSNKKTNRKTSKQKNKKEIKTINARSSNVGNIVNVSFEKVLDSLITPEELENVKLAKEKKEKEIEEFSHYNEVIEVDNKLYKVKKNKAKTTVVSGFKINLDPSKNQVICNNNSQQQENQKEHEFFSNELDSNIQENSIIEEKMTPEEPELSNEFLRNNLIISPISTHSNCNEQDNFNLNNYSRELFNNNLVPSSLQHEDVINPILDDNNEIVDLSNFESNHFEQLSNHSKSILETNSVLEEISNKIDTLVSNTQKIKDELEEQDNDRQEVKEFLTAMDDVVPPTFINVPIPTQLSDISFSKKINKFTKGNFKKGRFVNK